MAQHQVGDAAARDALATYRKLDERINAQMLAAVHAAEATRPLVGPEVVADSRTRGLEGGKGLPSHLDTPLPAPTAPIAAPAEANAPPAAFRMGQRHLSL
ncbi:MAG: hypothetical protein FJZ01_10835 [Candidatus Sericytochromatia bacterium]|nr:hypothetical protein [Candidatus Tanganyikabacteria bacterium]